MAARSVNKVILIGNLTRDPELRYTPQGHAVCSVGLATNREWTNADNGKTEATEYHNLVAWNKLAELCSQLLVKGTKIYVEGRLQTRDWTDDSGVKKYKTEVVIEEMVILVSKKTGEFSANNDSNAEPSDEAGTDAANYTKGFDEIMSDEIPF